MIARKKGGIPIKFRVKDHPLSNWALVELTNSKDSAIKYNCLEQNFFHLRCLYHDEDVMAETILEINDPNEMKEFSKLISESPGWKEEKVIVMTELLKLKFNIPKFRKELIGTYPEHLQHNVGDIF